LSWALVAKVSSPHAPVITRHKQPPPFISPSHEALDSIAVFNQKTDTESRCILDSDLVYRSEYSILYLPQTRLIETT
jgi:hypothetical protein